MMWPAPPWRMRRGWVGGIFGQGGEERGEERMGGWGRVGGGRLPFWVRPWPALRVLTSSLYDKLPSQRSGAPKNILSSLVCFSI